MDDSLVSFKKLLDEFSPTDQKEVEDLNRLKAFFDKNGIEAFNNENYNDGHITGSAFVFDSKEQKILLLHHKKLNRWLQPGGHSDGSADIVATAKREVLEETGVSEFKCDNKIFDIDIHMIPAREGKSPEHYHYDVRILLLADSTKPLVQNLEETNDLKWININEIGNYISPEHTVFFRVAEKLKAI